MQHKTFFKKELVNELRFVANLMKKEKSVEKKIYYFSAAYGITSRTLRYAFSRDVLLADLVLNTSYHSLFDRYQRAKSGDNTVPFDEKIFDNIVEGLKDLANAFESDTSIQEPLELIVASSFSATGPGNYLREKGDLTL
ncbi:MAG: hypothetical protein WC164_03525 [Patescibacteria group bacterium]|uniref:hypothetical protein n=1 Tax=Methanospirillum sp. TaxID=45200 RepID=UPI002CD34328|nr:hypothetical protein [Methanospirillum sp.]HPY60637.1 hypothetical protein [Methanospirillum sp.]